MTGEEVEVQREVSAVQIPSGDSGNIKKGEKVIITQFLGGSYTIHVPSVGKLFRIAPEDADALGKEVQKAEAVVAEGAFEEEQVWAAMKQCYDPEIPVNIVDLGLIYSMDAQDAGDNQYRVDVKMTLTASGCGMGPTIAADAKQKILAVPQVKEAEVEVVWEPAWNPSMISADGKAKLGIED